MPSTLTPQERDDLLRRFQGLLADGPRLLRPLPFSDLASLVSETAPVISLYVDLGPQARHNDAWSIALKSSIRDAIAAADPGQRDAARAELEWMERRVSDHVSVLGRGAVLVSAPGDGRRWEAGLPVALPTRVRIGPRPYLRPLARIRDEHERLVVVCLDKQRARLFLMEYGYLREVADMFEDVPGHHKQGGRSQMRLQRHHDAHVLWHAGAVAHATELLLAETGTRHLVVAGPTAVRAEFRNHLGNGARMIGAELGLPIDASETQIAEAVVPRAREIEAREEAAALDRINETVARDTGRWGLRGVLDALNERRVRLLVVDDRYRASGAECRSCRLLFPAEIRVCPACSGTPAGVDDVVDAALEMAVGQEAELELVRSEAAREALPPRDPVGVELRY